MRTQKRQAKHTLSISLSGYTKTKMDITKWNLELCQA